MPHYGSVALGIWISVGGRYEDDRLKGAAHFLEHILFKGSRKYSCEEIKKLVEGVGGSLNAFTTEESTCYFAKIPARHLSQALDVLVDMVLYPKIPAEEVEKERRVILEEIKMYRDLPQHRVLELLEGLVWPDHPLGKNLAGTYTSVGAMQRVDLKVFHRSFYQPQNAVVAVAGRIPHKKLLSLLKTKTKKWKGDGQVQYQPFQGKQLNPRLKIEYRQIEQMHVALGLPAFQRNHKDRIPLALLNVILGANMSSRLFNEVREKRGLAYAIGSTFKPLADTGLFLIRAGIDNTKIDRAVSVIFKEIERLTRSCVSSNELIRAKDYLTGQVMMELEDTLEHMLWIGDQLLMLNKVRTLKRLISQVRKVTRTDIRRVAREIFRPNAYNLAVVGPLKDSQKRVLSRIVGCPAQVVGKNETE